MKESIGMNQNLAEVQTLTPFQVQFNKMLEMNTPAIEDDVQRNLDENPALERAENNGLSSASTDTFAESSTELQRADYGNEDDMPAYLSRPSGSRYDGDDRRIIMEGTTAETESMSTRLKRQLSMMEGLDTRTRAFAEYIIDTLDSNGRMTSTLSSIADDISVATGLFLKRDDILPAFKAVRSLDPAGVGAVDLRDCLLLQLNRRKPAADVQLSTEIIDRYFELLVGRRIDKLRAKTGASDSQLTDALNVIHSLNPKPGGSDAEVSLEDRAMQITPDFLVEADQADPTESRFLITMTQRIPELSVAQWHVTGENRHKDDDDFVRRRTREAADFIKMLKMRTETLMAVMRAIVDIQVDFFRTEDKSRLRPMILKDIEERTGLGASAISRATAGKYVATPGGIYPLKVFFSERPIEGSDVSMPQIQHAIRTLVDNEDKTAPLSDDALAIELSKSGMNISRRTVAKYREQMKIPNSRGRRSMNP